MEGRQRERERERGRESRGAETPYHVTLWLLKLVLGTEVWWYSLSHSVGSLALALALLRFVPARVLS